MGVLMHKFQGHADDAILETAVPFAEKLLERHIKQIDELSSGPGAPENEHVDKERKIVERLGARGPMKYRDLVRTFSDQSKDANRPAIDRLLTEGVLVEDEQGRLHLVDELSSGREECEATV
jgi:hypothetical protein